MDSEVVTFVTANVLADVKTDVLASYYCVATDRYAGPEEGRRGGPMEARNCAARAASVRVRSALRLGETNDTNRMSIFLKTYITDHVTRPPQN
jgi:hypothetical protein